MRKLVVPTATFFVAAVSLTLSAPGIAAPRPTVDPSDNNMAYGLCIANGGDTNAGSGAGGACAGAICYCCYDDGCFICNNLGSDCTWDQKASARSMPQRIKRLLARPEVKQPSATVRPPSGGPPGAGLLGGSKELSTQGPAGTGKAVAPPPAMPAGRLQ